MLQRSSQIGEFYRMAPPAVWDSSKRLPPSYLDIMIYDEESDRHVHIPFEQALYATCYGHANGPVGNLFKFDTMSADVVAKCNKSCAAMPGFTGGNAPAFEGGVADGTAGLGSWLQDGGRNYTTANGISAVVTKLIEAVRAGVWVPLEIVIARPFIEHLMLSAIVTVSGRDTGATLFGPADMQISANTSVKTIEGHYTCHTKSVITKPQNVYVMRDVMCSGYVAGGNTRFFGVGPDISDHADPAAVRQGIEERLSFQNDADGEYSSMIAFCAHYGDGAKRDQVISISDRLLPWEVNNPNGDKDYFPGGSNTYRAYASVFGLNTIHFGEDVRAAENMEFISQGSMNNSLCFVGPHRKYNPFSNQYHELVPGQGHFGPDAIPGDARWRRGEAVSLKAARDNMVSLEAAAHAQMFMSKRP
jgi:hypothetical protein